MHGFGAEFAPIFHHQVRGRWAVMHLEQVVCVVPLRGQEAGIADQAADHWLVQAMDGARA